MPWSTVKGCRSEVVVDSAAIQDRDGAGLILDKLRGASVGSD